MFKEFKEFALKGNIFDLAIGVVIGGAFGKIVSSLVGDIIMPILGIITGKIDLTAQKWIINPGTGEIAELSIKYGQFLQSIIDFLLISLSIFFVMKALAVFKKKQEQKPAEEKPAEEKPSREELLLAEIRDILKEKVF
jgi:large conductance mechanosensitive channel